MIKFSGRIDRQIKTKILKQRDRQLGWLMLGAAIIGVIGTTIFSIIEKELNYELLISTIIITIMAVISLIAPQFNCFFRIDWNYTVSIENGEIRKVQFQQTDVVKEVKKIKKVIDEGKWYIVIYSGLSNAIICQKDLLVEGTLEEFETIFAGKIKRRCRKK